MEHTYLPKEEGGYNSEALGRLVRFFGQYTQGPDKLNVGCGRYKFPGWTNLDAYASQQPDVVANLNDPLPFKDEVFDCVFASHVLEHVDDIVFTVGELWRVLKPGGFLIGVVPYAWSDSGMCNPFHKSKWSQHTIDLLMREAYSKANTAGSGANEGKFIGTWEREHVMLVPNEAWRSRPQTEIGYAAQHYINVIEEMQFVLRKRSE